MDTLLKETVNASVNSRYPEMSLHARKRLEEILIRRDMTKGELLLKEGEVSRHIVFVGKGMVRQFYYKNGKDVTEHFSYEGCIAMCLESLLKHVPTRLMVEALEDGTLYYLPYDKLMLETEVYWELNVLYRKILEFSLIVSQDKADAYRFETAHERYVRLLHDHPEIVKRAPLSHIASYLLMTPETLSRVRAGAFNG
ncbi:MAG: Crp/Fnr family transcriptional regulator [Bacteroides sp.]|nr:Crp/Fnr family transcriptional regulator [Bacteroides sp.]